jgi:GNAT superfamily N-acetyltransferase
LVAWRNETPVEWQQRFAEACSAADADIPHGELSHEPMVWTAQRVRDADARRIRQGRRWHTTIALSAAGELAAYTQLGGAASEPGTVHQYETFVRREHRGHGLGIRVKLANLRALEAELDGPAVVHTLNAPTNTAMIRVNDQLGFRPVALRTGWERIL